MTEGIFITGTDTGVGKTTVACALLRMYVAAGSRAVGMKPVAAGGGEDNDDLVALAAAGNVDAPLSARCPYAFADAIAPHLAARAVGVTIDLHRIQKSYEELSARADRVVVEAAGGALAPLGERIDMLDIARALALPVLMVVGVRLGCLNHALLTSWAIRARGLELVGWIANSIDPTMACQDENVAALERRLSAPCIASIRWGYADAPEWNASEARLNFSRPGDPC
ncbi:MAG TPA: dethiobiotin synthase [Casimicrobiaceae bacterium]|jgi:dethiobiotin synthetase